MTDGVQIIADEEDLSSAAPAADAAAAAAAEAGVFKLPEIEAAFDP
eukprot:CAMPEP_0179446442 /NCGR_PEP_ID=MMETSP0799-20121207/29852_1 /TAXON_ID=46947 /ORGANISM="Geminigera cryophila, Strain CCMP2564" /LENGTH=45 /DNA_ID= /DNA_START= /DNA_END= /DNA_ORIENTATION=